MHIQIYLLPYDSGQRDVRMGRGPAYWIENGLPEMLRAKGHTASQSLIEAQDAFPTEVKTSFDLYRRLAERIQADCRNGAFPLVLSGNCGGSLGGVSGLSGLSAAPLGVAWFDAHGDFNTPETTLSGFLDGMPLATAAGLGWKNLAGTLPGFRPVQGAHILHIGGRDFDPAEEQLMLQEGVMLARASSVRADGIAAAIQPSFDRLAGQVNDLYLHFDVDSLDPLETPANHFPAPGGLFPAEVVEAVEMLRDRFAIRGMTVASFDPRYDETRKTLAAVFQVIGVVLT